jgi:hypothetical protein|tara:strand:+ start:466 stop:774 length:309 start_codon:yes stop_codon:yes gene_type:complete
MGDRFYQQQYGTTMGALAEPVRPTKSMTKAELVLLSGTEKLLVKDLHRLRLVNLEFVTTLELPTGRLKAPYITQCEKIDPDINWSKLTVANLKEVITQVSGI